MRTPPIGGSPSPVGGLDDARYPQWSKEISNDDNRIDLAATNDFRARL